MKEGQGQIKVMMKGQGQVRLKILYWILIAQCICPVIVAHVEHLIHQWLV